MGARDRSVFAVARGWRDNPLFRNEPFTRGEAWLYLIENAAFQATKFDSNGRIITIERGQLATSVRRLAADWRWSKSAVDRFLTRLKSGTGDGPMIGTATGTGQLLITICKYNDYQFKSGRAGTPTGTADGTATGTAAGQQRDTKEECKEDREEEPKGSSLSATSDCDAVFAAFGRVAKAHDLPRCAKVSHQRRAACKARIREHGLEAVIQAIEHIPKSAFLRGEAGDWRGANIDFLLRPHTVTKILEGTYDDRRTPHDRQHPRSERSTTREIGERVAARFAEGSHGSVDLVPRLGPPRRDG